MSPTHDELHRIVAEVCAEEGWPVPVRDGDRSAVERVAGDRRARLAAVTEPDRRRYTLNGVVIGWDDPAMNTPNGLASQVRSLLQGLGVTLDPSYSDEWTNEDLRDWSIASFLYFESQHPDEDWGTDYSTYGDPPCPPPAT